MAEKILNTRIQLRYDTWDNWQKTDVANKGGNLVLKAGEVAVTVIAPEKSDFTTPPTVMFKVGDGEHKFSELPWASGLAADVYPWAKSPTAPVIGDGKITIKQGTTEKGSFTVNQSGDTTITLDADTDTDTQYQLVLNGHTLKLQSKAKNGTWADVSGQSFTLPDNNTTYTFAEGTTNGAFSVTPSGGTAQSVKIHGLGSAAYTDSSAYATAAQGKKADSALQSVKILNTNNTTAQTANASEAITGSGTINLHKVSKTGSYNDLNNKPTIPTGFSITANATDDDIVVLTGTGGTNSVSYDAKHAKKGPTNGYTSGNTTTSIGGSGASGTIKVPQITVDSYGHVTKAEDESVTIAMPTIPTVGNGALTIKVGDKGDVSGTGSFTANQSSAGTITLPVYTKTEVDEKIVGAVQYLGTVGSANELAALNPDSPGDFCRVSTAFGSYHVGDLLLCKTLKEGSTAATWDVIHGEIDKDTWTANSKTAAGYVTKGEGQANQVWKTDASGNPGWRDDANTDTKVTSAANHYTPAADSASQLSVDASSTVSATWNSTSLVTGVNIQRDSKGHVTGVTVDSIKMPANPDTNTAHTHTNGVGLIRTGNGGTSGSVDYKVALADETLDTNAAVSRPAANANRTYPVIADKNGKLATIVPWVDTNTDTNQKVKANGVTFDANDTVEMKAGTGLKVTASNATAGSEYVQYDIDDAVVFVLNGGSSTEVI